MGMLVDSFEWMCLWVHSFEWACLWVDSFEWVSCGWIPLGMFVGGFL